MVLFKKLEMKAAILSLSEKIKHVQTFFITFYFNILVIDKIIFEKPTRK